MPDIRYGTARDSKLIAMVSPGLVLVVAAAHSTDKLVDLWAAVSAASTTQPVLDALTRGGISTTPDFVLASFPIADDGTSFTASVIVRGPITVHVTSVGTTEDVSGEGVSTWIERVIPEVARLEIGSGAEKLGELDFVLITGSAPVSRLAIGAPISSAESQSLTTAAPPAEPAVVEPEPVAEPQPAQVPEPTPAVDPPEPMAEPSIDPGVTITGTTISAPPQGDGAPDNGGYDFLFGETVKRTVEEAAVRSEPSDVAGDHDGKTSVGLSTSERRAARAARQGRSLPTEAPQANFVLEFSTGDRELLDQGLVIGRAPSASKVSASSVPRLVTVGGPDQDISRNHVQVVIEGGTIMITDLHSRNGTMLTLPGRPPQQLRGGQPTAALVGSIVDLGSGVTFTLREN